MCLYYSPFRAAITETEAEASALLNASLNVGTAPSSSGSDSSLVLVTAGLLPDQAFGGDRAGHIAGDLHWRAYVQGRTNLSDI